MKKLKYDWGVLAFIVGYHLALLVGLPIYFLNHSFSWGIFGATMALVYISGIAVTAGYHRLYSHSTYKTNKWVEAVFLFFATLATQGSALKWSYDHRKHHAYVDTDRDPYSIKKGFFFAHMLWMFHKSEPIDMKVVADLGKNPLVMFQHRFYGLLMVLTNLLMVAVLGWYISDFLTAFVFFWGVRLFILHHFTWFINSLAHTWGARPFSQEHSAVDCYAVSLFTFGEGYHNYHHTFANDYRNGIRWYHFDPTKWLIWLLAKCKLAHGLRRVSHERIREKIILERKNELLEQLQKYVSANRAIWEEKVEKITQDLLQKCAEFGQLTQQYQLSKKNRELAGKLREMRQTLKEDWQTWRNLSKEIMRLS